MGPDGTAGRHHGSRLRSAILPVRSSPLLSGAILNESMPYVGALSGYRMYGGEHGQPGPGNIPAWLVVDQRYRDRYIFADYNQGNAFRSSWLIPASSSRPIPCGSWLARPVYPRTNSLPPSSVSTHSPGPVSTRTTTAGKCLRSLLRRPEQQAQSEPRRGRPPALLWRQDGSGRPGDQGRYPHRCQRTCSVTTGSITTALRCRQCQCPSDGTHLPRSGGTIARR